MIIMSTLGDAVWYPLRNKFPDVRKKRMRKCLSKEDKVSLPVVPSSFTENTSSPLFRHRSPHEEQNLLQPVGISDLVPYIVSPSTVTQFTYKGPHV